MFRDTSFPVGL